MQQVQDLVTLVPWTFVATICNLFIQIYLIKRFLFKPVNAMLEKRKAMADSVSKEMTAEELRDFIENMPEGTVVSIEVKVVLEDG